MNVLFEYLNCSVSLRNALISYWDFRVHSFPVSFLIFICNHSSISSVRLEVIAAPRGITDKVVSVIVGGLGDNVAFRV
jgi:hypothetical protein